MASRMTRYVWIGVFGDYQSTNLCPVTFLCSLFLSGGQGYFPRNGAMNLSYCWVRAKSRHSGTLQATGSFLDGDWFASLVCVNR